MNAPLILIILLSLSGLSSAAQKDTIYVFGPGGPYPALKEVAEKFETKYTTKVIITKGPVTQWHREARSKADLLFSGSENMMTTFMDSFRDEINLNSILPLYYRKSGLLVRKGNPKNIKGLMDLQKPGLQIMVVNGAGLLGVWEDMLGKLKNMEVFRNIRSNIKHFADNSGSAEKMWKENRDIDVWITWNIWQISNFEIADFVPVKEKYTIYRDCGIVLTKKGETNEHVKLFYEYLKSKESENIFNKWGWK